jgi:hypothetical protein
MDVDISENRMSCELLPPVKFEHQHSVSTPIIITMSEFITPNMQRLPLSQLDHNSAAMPTKRIKPGPKRWTVKDRAATLTLYTPPKPKTQQYTEVSIRQKVNVIKYFLNHQIYEPAVAASNFHKSKVLPGLAWDGA